MRGLHHDFEIRYSVFDIRNSNKINTKPMRFLFFSLLLALGCGGKPSAEDGAGASNATAGVRFATTAPVTDFRSPDNWCNPGPTAPEGAPVGAEASNTNRRYFEIGDGTYHIVTRAGNTAASWMVRRLRDGGLELFTSANFPTCLSNRDNFSINPDGRGFYFDNGRGIAYPVEWLADGPTGRVTIEFAPGAYYGIEVFKKR
jgi:hypothetical protein